MGQPRDSAFPLGPFKGGMANIAEIGTINDDQLSFVENFDFDLDGSLKSRPAIVEEAASPAAGQAIDPLGYYVRADGKTFLVATTNAATWIYDLELKTWTSIWSSKASGMVQYDNKIVLCSTSVAGGYWENGSFTSTPTMPLGVQIVFYQERFWTFGERTGANATTVFFSNVNSVGPSPTSIFTWTPATDFFTVQKGDGQWITGLLADINSLIIFRNRSTYQFTYPSSPFSGTLRDINTKIGADNQWAFGQHESYHLVLSQGFLYQFINYQFYPLNSKRIDFQSDPSSAVRFDLRLSVFGQRAIVWFSGRLWVYSILTNTWSTWSSPSTGAAMFLEIPPSSLAGDDRVALAVTGIASSGLYKLLRISTEPISGGVGEAEFACTIRTKAYSFDESGRHKRMFYWAIELRSSSGVMALAHPVAVPAAGTTWNAMSETTWNHLSEGSWNNPLVIVPVYTDDVPFPTAQPVMALVKCIQDMRFLRIFFEVILKSDGTQKTSPARIYSITPYVRAHGGVSEKVS